MRDVPKEVREALDEFAGWKDMLARQIVVERDRTTSVDDRNGMIEAAWVLAEAVDDWLRAPSRPQGGE